MPKHLNLALAVQRQTLLRLVESSELVEPINGARRENFPKLLEKLDEVVRSKPGEYSEDTIRRVRGLIDYKIAKPDLRTPFGRFLTEVQDWKLFFSLHDEWQGISTTSTRIAKIPGARQFYASFGIWARESAKTKADGIAAEKGLDEKEKAALQEEIRKSFTKQLFPPLRNDWCGLTTIEDWKQEFGKHPEWQGLSTGDMRKNKSPGASAFYYAFSEWTCESARAESDRIAAEKGWNEEKKAALQKRITRSFTKQLFPPRLKDWSGLATIEDWKQEFAKHPEWQGLSTGDMGDNKSPGAYAFYGAFGKWARESAKTESDRIAAEKGLDEKEKSHLKESIRKALVRSVFPERQAPFKYEFEQGKVVHFGSYPERLVGLLLHKYGLVSSFEEGGNVHVRTNGKKLHSLDFLVGRRFIEFHPLNIHDKKTGSTIEDVRTEREQNITNPEFSKENGFSMLFIWELDQFHSVVLQDPEIRGMLPEQYRDLPYEQFQADLREAYQKSIGYDIVNPPEKRKRKTMK